MNTNRLNWVWIGAPLNINTKAGVVSDLVAPSCIQSRGGGELADPFWQTTALSHHKPPFGPCTSVLVFACNIILSFILLKAVHTRFTASRTHTTNYSPIDLHVVMVHSRHTLNDKHSNNQQSHHKYRISSFEVHYFRKHAKIKNRCSNFQF